MNKVYGLLNNMSITWLLVSITRLGQISSISSNFRSLPTNFNPPEIFASLIFERPVGFGV
jgi:hypothetical protein